jgi:predicted nucleotidyltransferase
VSLKYADNYRCSILYGSQARGTARPDSDVDVLVFLHTVDHWGKRAIIDLAYDEYLATGVDISPLIMSVDKYERQKRISIPLIAEIERDMVRL